MSTFALRALAVCVFGLVSAGVGAAQTKVAIVNFEKAINDTAELKKAQAALEAKFKPRQTELEKIQKELADMQAQIDGGKLTQQAAQDIQARGQRRQREAQRLAEDLQGDVERERNDFATGMSQRMGEVIRKLAEAKGFDFVVPSNATLYFKPALDITAEATAAYDKEHPAK